VNQIVPQLRFPVVDLGQYLFNIQRIGVHREIIRSNTLKHPFVGMRYVIIQRGPVVLQISR
jgi:hypothetical protein